MLMFLYGPDTYSSRQRLHQLKQGFKKKYDPSGSNVSVLDGEKLTLEVFRRAAGTAGFLASKRLVVVESVIEKNSKKEIQKELVEYLSSPDWTDENVVIFWEGDINSSNRRPKKTAKKKGASSRSTRPLLEKLLAERHIEEFPTLRPAELVKWIQDHVQGCKGSIDSYAIDELMTRVGTNLWQMTQEIDKLTAFRQNEMISADDVRLLVRSSYDENIFHLTDAIGSKDLRKTLELIGDQLSSGAHELYILTMLTRQFRLLLQARDLIETEPHPATVASRLGLPPFIAQQLVSQAQKFTLSELIGIHQQLAELDMKFKTSEGDPRLLFDLFAVSVCKTPTNASKDSVSIEASRADASAVR